MTQSITVNTGSIRLRITPAQVEALRDLLDNDPDPVAVNPRTARVLRNLYLVETGGYSSSATLYSLTPAGRRAVTDYVERTGDGPEALKARFRF